MTSARSAAIAIALTFVLLTHGASAELLTAKQAVARAARHNPNLEAVAHDMAAAGHAYDAADRALVPSYFTNVEGQYAEQFTGSARGIAIIDSQGLFTATGIRYTSPIATAFELGAEAGVSWRSSIINPATTEKVTIGPNYSGRLYATVRQPILQGAGSDAVFAPLEQADTGRTIAQRQRDQSANQVILDVLSAYWELWYAQRAVEVQERALEVAERQYEDTRVRIEELGTVARVELLQFATDRAVIQESLASARRTRATSAVELGRLLGTEPQRAMSLVAAGTPPAVAAAPPLEALYEAARERAPGLQALEAQVTLAQQRVKAAEDQDQPRLDAYATMSMSGLWADDDVPGIGLPGDRPALGAIAGLELELPMGPRVTAAALSQARAELEAAKSRYEAERDAVEAAVASLAIELEAAEQQVELAQETSELAAELAQAERDKIELGAGTPADLVRAQQSHRESQLRHLRALVDQAAARYRLENQVGALLVRFADAFPKRDPS